MPLPLEPPARRQLTVLSTHLRATRKAVALSQRALAAHLRVSATSLADWEGGRDDPTMAHLIQWARALDLRLALVDPCASPALPSDPLDEDESWEHHEMRRLATSLWARRRSRKMSQTTLATLVGVGRISMQRWECAQVFPRPIAFLSWAGALDCGVALQPASTHPDTGKGGVFWQKAVIDDGNR